MKRSSIAFSPISVLVNDEHRKVQRKVSRETFRLYFQILKEGGVIWDSLRKPWRKLKRGEVFDVSRETQKF